MQHLPVGVLDMVLRKQNVPVIFSGGIDSTDPYLLSPNKVTALRNMQFDDAQTIITRSGLFLLATTPAVATVPSPYARTNPSFSGTPYRMAQNMGALLLESSAGLFSRESLHQPIGTTAYDPKTTLQARTGTGTADPGRPDFARATVETEYIGSFAQASDLAALSNPLGGNSCDMGRIENYDSNGHTMSLFAWLDQTATPANFANVLRIRAYDEGEDSRLAAGSLRVARTLVFDLPLLTASTFFSQVRVVTNSTDFFVLMFNKITGVITIPLRLTASTGVVSYPTYTATSLTDETPFDAIVDSTDGQIVLAYQSGANVLTIAKLNAAASAVASSATFATGGVFLSALSLVHTILTSGERLYQALHTRVGSTTVLRGSNLTSTGGSNGTSTLFTASAGIGRVTGVDYDTSNGTSFAVFYDLLTSGGVHQLTQDKLLAAVATNTGGTAGIAQNAHLYARPVVYGSAVLSVQLPVMMALDAEYPSIFVVQAQTIPTGYYPPTVQKTLTTARLHWGSAGSFKNLNHPTWRLQSSWKETLTGDMLFPAHRWGAQATAVQGSISAEHQLWQARLSFTSQT